MAVYLYMFVVCIKMDAIMLTKAAKHTWKLGFCCFVFPIIFTIAVAIGQNYFLPGASGSAFPVQFTIMSSISYFIVITRALDELNLLSSEVGQISLSVAKHNEVVSGTFQILGVALGQQDVKTSVYAILSLCSLIMFAFFVIRPMLRYRSILWYGICNNGIRNTGRMATWLFHQFIGDKESGRAHDVWSYDYCGMLRKLLTEQTYATSTIGIVVVNAIITPLIEMLYKPAVTKKFNLPTLVRLRIRSLRMTSTVEDLQIVTCIQDEEIALIIIRLLEALNPKEISPISAYVIHLVSMASQCVPTLASYKNHLRKFNQHSSLDNIIRAFLNYVEKSQGLVQIHPFQMISHYKYIHQPICRLSEKIHAPLIVMPFFNSEEAHSIDGTLRIFNTNVQASAACTIGLLVDRGLRSSIRLTTFSYTMAVIFLGGVDDREALALATRASCHPNVIVEDLLQLS
ncbi:cation/H(+) antiporter 15 [Gossypium hirsutum]|uniref:Cation/H(+) antiporter 15 n=1 Tax=Gossypium hirsutum TaxID=3635 RepID=A0A1U8LXE8_GOSHI|nr:cation/H(+) antiporter 15-like [Gossypium hirsutum]